MRRIRDWWWIDIRHGGVRYRRRCPSNRREDALKHDVFLRRELAEHGSLAHLDAGKQRHPSTFSEFAERWMQTYPAASYNKASEVESKRSILRAHLLPAFGRFRLDSIGAQQIEEFKADCAKRGLKAKSVNNILTVLRCLLRSAVEWEELPKLPRVRFERVRAPEFRFLSEEEAGCIVDAAPDVTWRAAVLLGLHGGLRFGEIAALSWADVDFPRRQVMVRAAYSRGVLGTPKNGRVRRVPMTRAIADALDRLDRGGPHVLVVRGRPLVQDTAIKRLRRICDRAGVRRCGWHVLRHTFASHLVQRGVPLAVIKELLGHSSLEMTLRYAHLAPAGAANVSPILVHAVDLLDRGQQVGNSGDFRQVATPQGTHLAEVATASP